MIGKRGVMGESTITMYRVLLVTFVAFAILGISSMIYEYKINSSDTDSMLFTKAMIDCIAPKGVLNLDSLGEEDIFSFCGFGDKARERFFVSLEINDDTEKIASFDFGNEELEWVSAIYSSGLASENIEVYEPGYYNGTFSLKVLRDGEIFNGKMKVEVVTESENK